MTKTLQEQLLGKGIVKQTSLNKAMADPFSDKSQLNRFGKPDRWRIWMKSFNFPENFIKICCLCGRKFSERDKNKLVHDSSLLYEIRLECKRKNKTWPMGAALVCPTCAEIREKEKEDGDSD